MSDVCHHSWDVGPAEAAAIQRRLASLVIPHDDFGQVDRIAGIDVGFVDGRVRAAVVVLTYPALRVVETSIQARPATFPYVPGLLSFREVPAVLTAYEALRLHPDLIIVDGHGIAHPRRMGIAAHLGLCLDLPTIGCAKSLLVGGVGALGEEVGSTADIVDGEEVIGTAVRTKRNVKPVFVSIGHRVSLATAVAHVLRCGRGYRLPEPQRQAHLAASARGEPKGSG